MLSVLCFVVFVLIIRVLGKVGPRIYRRWLTNLHMIMWPFLFYVRREKIISKSVPTGLFSFLVYCGNFSGSRS